MSEVTWNNGLHNRSRHPGAIIVGADGSVREFDRNGCMGVYAVIELDHERNGKWSNSTYRIVMSAGVRFFDWVPDFNTGRSFHDCSTWDEIYASVVKAVGLPLDRGSLVATLSAMRPSLAARIEKSEAILASLYLDDGDDIEYVSITIGAPTNRAYDNGYFTEPIIQHGVKLRIRPLQDGECETTDFGTSKLDWRYASVDNIIVDAPIGAKIVSKTSQRGYHGGYVTIKIAMPSTPTPTPTPEPERAPEPELTSGFTTIGDYLAGKEQK